MYGYIPECLLAGWSFAPCLPPYERPLDEPEISAEALSALALHVGADDAEAAYYGALRWGAWEAWREFDVALRGRSSFCPGLSVSMAFSAPDLSSNAPLPVNAHVFSLPFDARSNLAVTIRHIRFYAGAAGVVGAAVAWKAPDGSVAHQIWSGVFNVNVGANAVPGITGGVLRTGAWAPWPATLEFSWTGASGATGLPLTGTTGIGGCGCGGGGPSGANFGLGFVVETYCSTEGLACRYADLLRPAVLAHAARYFLTSATSSAKMNEWTMTNRASKERGADRLKDAAAEAVRTAVQTALTDCDDCCFKNEVQHRLIWRV